MYPKRIEMNDTKKHVFAEQVRLMYGQTKKFIIGGLLSGLILCAILWDVIDRVYIISWFAAIVLLLALRGALYIAFISYHQKSLHLSFWSSAFVLLTAIYGVAMGSISISIHLTNDLAYHFVVTAWLIGYSGLGATAYSMKYRAVLALFIPIQGMLIVSLILAGTTLHLLTVAATLIWCFMVFSSTLPVNRSMLEAIKLNHQLGLEIEKRTEAEKQLYELSIEDGLTGLFNRRHFETIFEKELKRANRARAELSIALIDLDSFKQFNDTYGHQAGDDCLRRVSKAIRKHANRSSDLVARYGGEELVVLLPNTNSEQAIQLAERMRIGVKELAIPHVTSKVANNSIVSVSIGIATLEPSVSLDKFDLLQKADKALYKAKAEGRNQTVVSSCVTAQQEIAVSKSSTL
jgi:diguanylate cyclase (GGDEF)-like protein